MDETKHKELLYKIENLKSYVATRDTKDLLCTIALEVRKGTNNTTLVSPFKQYFYLVGIIFTTSDPKTPEAIDKEELINLLNEIFNHQVLEFYPSEDDPDDLPKEWVRNREVAMPAFLHYFNDALLASIEQVTDRIKEEIIPFDDVIEQELGITATQVLYFAERIKDYQENKLKDLYKLASEEKKIRHELLDRALAENWSLENLKEEANTEENSLFYMNYINKIDDLYVIDYNEISKNSDARIFFEQFSHRRDGSIHFTYMTESNPAEYKPLIKISDDKYLCPIINALFIAISQKLEDILINSSSQMSFLKHRDKLLEGKGTKLFLTILGENAVAYKNIYESKDLQYEHDTVIISGENLYILEAKASPPIEPFRNPDKAYNRIKRRFASDRGIQKGFDQAERVRKGVESNPSFNLYNRKGELVVELKQHDFKNVFCICITRDNYGPLATTLDLLLEKEDNTPYPWVVNILDLEAIAQGFNLLNLRENKFVDYLKARVKLHGKLFGTDELEYVGYYLMHRSFTEIFSKNADRIFLNYDYSDIFDKIYLASKMGDKYHIPKTAPRIIKRGEGIYITSAKDAKELKPQKMNKSKSKKTKRRISKKSRKINKRKR